MKKTIALLLAAVMLTILLSGCSIFQKTSSKFTVEKIAKYGNITLASDVESFLNQGFSCGDVVTVEINGQTYDMPVGDSFSDVNEGSMICRLDYDDDEVTLAINMGDLATSIGLAEKEKIDNDPGYKWTYNDGINEPVEVLVSMKEKEGYLKQYKIRSLQRTNEREDYAALSDEEFANFRVVTGPYMKNGLLYRASSPLDSDLGRSEYVDAAMEQYGIKNVINLQNDESELAEYESYADSYTSTCDILCLQTDYDFTGEIFRESMKNTMLYILENDGPFLIHCKEGKDRTGIAVALIQGLTGADYDDIIKEYMKTYENYYGITTEDEIYSIVENENLFKPLCNMLDVTDPSQCTLREEIEDYLLSCGLTEDEIAALESKLAK